MKCKIETSNGVMFLKGIDGDKRLEIADYIELHDSSLLMVSLILDKKEYFYWGKNHVIYTKLWGCIDSMMNVVVPFIYSHMKVEFNYIRADKEVGYNIVFKSPEYASYYFNLYGVPVIYSTKKEMPEWDWVEHSHVEYSPLKLLGALNNFFQYLLYIAPNSSFTRVLHFSSVTSVLHTFSSFGFQMAARYFDIRRYFISLLIISRNDTS